MELWIIPHHVRPVVSLNLLKKGKMDTPKNGMDRLTLTEVGEIAFIRSNEAGLKFKMRRADPPFPWEMAFSDCGVECAKLTGYFIGPSTYRSSFRLMFLPETSGEELASKIEKDLKRDPLDSPYWNDDTWSRFIKRMGKSRMEIKEANRTTLDSFRGPSPSRSL
jgi:hypothetical protein